MSFGGAVSAMITSINNNKRNRISVFDKTKNTGGISGKLHFKKKASAKQLKDIREKLQTENRIKLIRKAVFFIILTCIFIYFFSFHKY